MKVSSSLKRDKGTSFLYSYNEDYFLKILKRSLDANELNILIGIESLFL